VTDIHVASAWVASALDAEVSMSTNRLKVADSEPSADEFAFDGEDTSKSFGKRARREPLDYNGRIGRRDRALVDDTS
jgi:hypothetical protein